MLSAEQYVDTLHIDEDELEEVEEEIVKATESWNLIIGATTVMDDFASKDKDVERLLRDIGTNYSAELHGNDLKAIASKHSSVGGGVMTRELFVDWYIRWMFTPEEGEGDNGCEDDEDSEPQVNFKVNFSDFSKAKEAVEGETWKCTTCRLMNLWMSGFCKGCEVKAPHYDTLPAENRKYTFAKSEPSTALNKSTGPKIAFGSSAGGGGGFGFGSTSGNPTASSFASKTVSTTSSDGNSSSFFGSNPDGKSKPSGILFAPASAGGFKSFAAPATTVASVFGVAGSTKNSATDVAPVVEKTTNDDK